MDAADGEEREGEIDEESEPDDEDIENESEEGVHVAKERQQDEGLASDDLTTSLEPSRERPPDRRVETVTEEFSDPASLDGRQVSRSPPRSRSPSPSSLEQMTASFSAAQISEIKDNVSSAFRKQRARQDRKHHSKRGRAGRPQGSKAKQDARYNLKLDKSGVWD
jgi:RIO kinase 2